MFAIFNSPLGELILSENNGGLNGCWFKDQPGAPKIESSDKEAEFSQVLKEAESWLWAYFSGKASADKIPALIPEGTDFQKMVWNQLRTIPAGKIISYGDLADVLSDQLGRNVSPRAVGHALGLNPVSIFLPCHRVIGKNRKLTGYAGGISRKEQLLILEGHEIRDGKLIR